MKIAFIVHEFPPQIGGISVRAYRIAKGLSERGHEINVYTSFYQNAPSLERIDGINVERYDLLRPRIARFIKTPMRIMPRMFKLFDNEEIQEADVVQSFFFLEFVSLVAAYLKLVKKKVFVLSPLFVPYYIKWSAIPYRLTFGKFIIRYADFLLPETNSERDNLIQFGIPSHKIQIIPDTINPDDYKQLPDPK